MKQSEANKIYLARVSFSQKFDGTSIAKIDADGDQCGHDGDCDCEDGEQYFSHGGCDICRDGAGDVYLTSSLTRSDIKARKFDRVFNHELCGACLCAIVNGDNSDLDFSVTEADVKPLKGMKA